jgi:hypothetical protein
MRLRWHEQRCGGEAVLHLLLAHRFHGIAVITPGVEASRERTDVHDPLLL